MTSLTFDRFGRARDGLNEVVKRLGADSLAGNDAEANDYAAEALRRQRTEEKDLRARALPKVKQTHAIHSMEGKHESQQSPEEIEAMRGANKDKTLDSSSFSSEYSRNATVWRPGVTTLTEHEQMEAEFKWYARYYAKPTHVDQEKHAAGWEPEEEGYFMPKKPFHNDKSLQTIEARLLREDPHREVFFDEYGQLVYERSPLREGSFKPSSLNMEYQTPIDEMSTKIPVPPKYTSKDTYYGFHVNLMSLTLSDHPLFTFEDYACVRLFQEYEEFMRRETINLVQYNAEKIAALRKLVKRQDKAIARMELGDARLDGALKELASTLENLQLVRKQKDREELEQLQLFRTMYTTWRSIQDWRVKKTAYAQQYGYLKTLVDRGDEVDDEEDDDAENDEEGDNEEKKAPKPKKKKMVTPRPTYVGYPLVLKVKKVPSGVTKAQEAAAWEDAVATELDERRKLFEVKLILEDPNHMPDQDQMEYWEEKKAETEREQILARMKKSRRHPGKPRYHPVLDRNVQVTPTHQCDPEEKQRRRDISEYQVQVELQVNDKIVMKTEALGIEFPHFKVTFAEDATLQLLSIPKRITCNVFHKRLLMRDRMSQVFVPVPELGAPPTARSIEWSGVGIEYTGLTGFDEHRGRFVEGQLTCSVYWEEDDQKKIQDVVTEFQETWNRKINRNNRALAVKRKRIVFAHMSQKDKIDPNDPRNAVILEILRREQQFQTKGKSLSAWEFMPNLYLVDRRYYQQSIRKKVLRARNMLPSGMSQKVPLDLREIKPGMYGAVHVDRPVVADTHAHTREGLALGKDHVSHSYSSHTSYDTVNLTQDEATIQERNRQKAKIMSIKQQVYEVGEVVKEDDLPTPKFVLLVYVQFLAEMFKPRSRKLHVNRKKLKPVAQPKTCRIRMQIMKAHNLPRRAGTDGGRQTDGDMFIEVSFQTARPERTSCRSGSQPSWNELLSLPFVSPGESMSPNYLQACRDDVHFNLFDEKESKSETRNTTLSERNVRWLGSIAVPFTTIYMNGSVEGRFQLEIPFFLLGYEKPLPNEPSSLWLYCTLDPPLVQPPQNRRNFRIPSKLSTYCSEWVRETQSIPHVKKRYIEAVVGDISGKPQLVCNYIDPQEPPQGLEDPDVFTRFVSQIPFLEDFHHANAGVNEIWCSSREFLMLTYGDWEEHAVLLCNYFQNYEQKSNWHSFVLLGHAVPEGRTAYVLRLYVKEDDLGKRIERALLFNAVTGEHWDVFSLDSRDVEYCPLQRVGLVFNQVNAWANIQLQDHPGDVSWDLDNSSMWKPLFNSKVEKKEHELELKQEFMATIQQPIKYFQTNPQYYIDRAFKIERLVERAFEEWRLSKPVNLTTSWDYGVCRLFREMLSTFELVKQKMSHEPDRSLLSPLSKAYSTVYGFPLCFTEADDPAFLLSDYHENPVLQALRNTRMHELKSEGVQFGMAIHIDAYANKIGTIWLYIAALQPNA